MAGYVGSRSASECGASVRFPQGPYIVPSWILLPREKVMFSYGFGDVIP